MLCIIASVVAFSPSASRQGVRRGVRGSPASISMEYIPDGLSKAQWKAIKEKEAAEAKRKGDLSKMGATRFKSRSFEAWQKAGGKHLFPVDPRVTPYEERPYMQRGGGDYTGSDLKKKGLFGRGQGSGSEKNELDDYYAMQKKAGKLDSSSILGEGEGIPWTSKALTERFSAKRGPKKMVGNAKATKKLSEKELAARKKNLFKPIKTTKKETAVTTEVEEKPKKKKGFFGF